MTDLLDFVRCIGQYAGGTASALEILLRVTAILLVAMLVALALRRPSAALRHWVWTLSLVGTLLIPLCYWAFPAWQWAVLPQRQQSQSVSQSPSIAPVAKDTLPAVPLQSAYSPHFSNVPAGESFEVAATPPAPIVEHSTPFVSPQPTWSWPVFFTALWALGTLLGLVWLGIGIVGAWYVARRTQPAADSHWSQIMQQLLVAYDFRRPITVRECSQVSVPMTWGLRRPVILVPASSAAWSEEIKRSVLLHELGHIRRGDCLTHLLGRLACVAYWFHPLVWLAARQLRKTSEQAADDVVLSSNIAPPDYAQHLVGIVGQMRGIHLFGHVTLPMASPSDLEGRVQAILDPQRNHRSLKRKTCYALMVVAALIVIPCAILQLGYAQDKNIAAAKEVVPAKEGRKPVEADVAKPDTTKTVSVNGVVVDQDGQHVAGVSVRAFTPAERKPIVESDAQGRFELQVDRDRMRGLAIVARSADGARQAFFKFDWNLEPGRALPPVRLKMSPARSINVQVLDGKGKPVADAVVGAVPSYAGLAKGHSDGQGKFTLRVPAGAPLRNIYALKSGLGLDYVAFDPKKKAASNDEPTEPVATRPRVLTLDGAKTVRIKFIDPEGRPLPGIIVSPWYFQKANRPHREPWDNLNISGVDSFRVKTDADGNLIWDATYGGTSSDSGTDVVVLPDGGFAMVVYTTSVGAGSYDALLVRTDETGNLLWQATYGTEGDDRPGALAAIPGGTFALVGFSPATDGDSNDMWVLATGGECCVSDCTDKECGDDGCGGSCGECGESMFCYGGACAAPVEIPDSGQTKCYDATGETVCPLPEEPFFGQDANYQGPPFSLMDNQDGTVTDLNTGLVWARCAGGQTPPDCLEQPPKVGWQEAADHCEQNNDQLPGDGWRIATRNELLSIMHVENLGCIPTQHFVGTPDAIWTGTDYPWDSDLAYAISFSTCSAGAGWDKTEQLASFRCVRGDYLEFGKLKDNDDGTVFDLSTGLMWQQQDDGQERTWEEALEYCEALNLVGEADWRLPHSREIMTLMDYTLPNASIDEDFFPTAGKNKFWTGTTLRITPDAAYAVNFVAAMGYSDQKKTMPMYVRCVR